MSPPEQLEATVQLTLPWLFTRWLIPSPPPFLTGVTVPKIAMFAAMDALTSRTCSGSHPETGALLSHLACTGSSNEGNSGSACSAAGGECIVLRDGYYLLSYTMVLIGALLGWQFRTLLPRLEALPLEKWRAAPRTATD